ncbi:MAG: GntR family transcriptional regulator [SAR324 cluster bacterium]|nr:GntR family transcriptional regulator [SAR324 cluster bacterium]
MVKNNSGPKSLQESVSGTLASSVYELLRDDIMSGNLRPGEKLRSEFLRDRYNVGNSPVREALNRLSSDGLVIREDQKGFRVSSVSKGDLMELLKTRCWLEEIALRESIAHGEAAWEERLVLAFHRLSRVKRVTPGDTSKTTNPDWEQLHRDFHMCLISNCGSKILQSYCEQLNDQADRYRKLALVSSFPNRNELEEHRAIKEATIEGDSEEAVKLLCSHYQKTVEIILEAGTGIILEDSSTQ